MTDRLDDLIEQELAASLAQVDARPPLRPRYLETRAATRRWQPLAALAGLPAALGTKVVVALAAVAIAGTGVAAKAALTGNPDPLTWGGQAQPRTPSCGGGPCGTAPAAPTAAATPEVRPTPAATPATSPSAAQGRADGGRPPAGLGNDGSGRGRGAKPGGGHGGEGDGQPQREGDGGSGDSGGSHGGGHSGH